MDEHDEPTGLYYNRQGEEITSEEWFALRGDRVVAQTDISDSVRVSTCWYGIPINMFGPPLIFETMVVGGVFDREKEQYTSEVEALAGHEGWVAHARLGRKPPGGDQVTGEEKDSV